MGRAGVEAVFGVDLKGQRGLGMRQPSTRVKETERETVLGARGGHGSLQKEDLIWVFGGASRGRGVAFYEMSIAKV